MDLAVGMRVDRYVLEQCLGAGGQAEVWRAHNPELPGRRHALKLVRLSEVSPSKIERARREARALAPLRHASLVGYFGLFEDRERELLGIVMEYVEGQSLEQLVRARRLNERSRTFVLDHVANALAYVHAHGIVHRDVKLENVLITSAFFESPEKPSTVKLIDFGIAVEGKGRTPLTRAGYVVGTAPYLSPEELEPAYWNDGAPAHGRSTAGDVFAFGVMAWRLIANDPDAHPTDLRGLAELDAYAIEYRRFEHDRWPPSCANPRWNKFVRRALALRPRDRLADGAALVAQLSALPTLDDDGYVAERRVITIPGEPPLLGPSAGERAVAIAPTQSERAPRRRPALGALAFLFALGAALGIVACAIYLLSQPGDDSVPPLPQPSSGRH